MIRIAAAQWWNLVRTTLSRKMLVMPTGIVFYTDLFPFCTPGLVDRDFGPKANLEDAMIDFLNSYIYVTEPDSGLVDAIDADQWLKNLASYAVLVNMDSPLNNLNNWFVLSVLDCKHRSGRCLRFHGCTKLEQYGRANAFFLLFNLVGISQRLREDVATGASYSKQYCRMF